jgi:curved DNA-binding protein CbpA
MRDPYKILGVTHDADRHVIQAAYRRLARRHHPDFGGDQELMAVVNEAWAVLGDATRREAFDAKRSRRPAASVMVTPEPAGPLAAASERRRPRRHGVHETTLDFGRYAGWTIRALSIEDPYYLEWLMRSQAGRMYRAEILTTLQERRDAQVAVASATTTSRATAPKSSRKPTSRSRFRRGR